MEFTQGVRFDSLGLLPEMTRALEKKNIEWSTPVQAGCIPPMREWKDVIAKAPPARARPLPSAFPSSSTLTPKARRCRRSSWRPRASFAMQITAELRDLAVL